MASLAAAHKGYFYQDIVTAYFLARSLVEPVRATIVDAKSHPNDRFDDLFIVGNDGKKIRRQFKHSDLPKVFEKSFLTSQKYDLRIDHLVRSWKCDPKNVRAAEYRVSVTWRVPTAKEDSSLLKASTALSSFAGQSRCFKLDVDLIWPKKKSPLIGCLEGTKRADFVAFAKLLVIELECPKASLDLDHPGPIEHLLLGVLSDRVGFGRYPNLQRGPVEAAALLILLANKTRGSDPRQSTLSPQQIMAELGLITDYGRIAQQFPFSPEVFVSIPDLRGKLQAKVKAGGITVLAGGPGAGKSWELTSLMRALKSKKVTVAAHYCYLEPGDPLVQSRITLNVFYGNLIAEILEAVPELIEHNPARYASGPKELQALLDAAGAMKSAPRLVVIVDGLDHIARVLRDSQTLAPADTQIARDLLALKLPKNVSVFIGSQPGDHITQLARSGTVLTVPSWEEPEVVAFLKRNGLGKKLNRLRLRRDDRNEFISELTKRAQGNALYCTYLCRELELRLRCNPGSDPLALLRVLPPNDGKLSTYYEYLLGNLDPLGRMVGELMGVIDFGVTPDELQEVFPLFSGQIDGVLTKLAPILEQTRGQGGLRIYHESFRRHLLDKEAAKQISLGAILKDVIVWLDGKGFLADPRAFRFLIPNLLRADRATEIFELIDRDFVVRAVAEGHSSAAIDANLILYTRIAADANDFPKLMRAGELSRALVTFKENLTDAFEYGTTYAAISGINRLSERLTFDGSPTYEIAEGLKLCSFCADAAVSPPWYAYMRKPLDSKSQQNMRAEMARFHGRIRTGETDLLRVRLVQFLGEAGDDTDPDYISSLAQRWADVAGADDLPRLRTESQCNGTIAEIFDLEFARRTSSPRRLKAAVNRVARRTTSAKRAIEALKLGVDPKLLAHWAINFDKYQIGIGDRGIGGEGESLVQWVLGIRIAAHVKPRLLVAEEIRTRGAGWYRNWLAFVIELARIELRAVHSPADSAVAVVEAFRALASDVHPFKGSPRVIDLYYARGAIHESFRLALNLLQTPEQFCSAITQMMKISSGTTTSLDRSKSGPLTPSALVELVEPFATRKEIHRQIRSEIVPFVQSQYCSGLYNEIASSEMALALLLNTMCDREAAQEHWKAACLYLCAYGMRKDITIYEILDNARALERGAKQHVIERLAKLLPMVYAVVLHTDGRETKHSVGRWFDELFATDKLSAAWLLGHSMADDGGAIDYRLEGGLVQWIENAGPVDCRLRGRLEQLVEGPSNAKEVEHRLVRIEALRNQDAVAAELEFQLLAAAVHGDPARLPKQAYSILIDYAKKSGFTLPIGGPDISQSEHKDDMSHASNDPAPRKLRWKRPKTPQALLRRIQEVLLGRKIPNNQLLEYCEALLVSWAGTNKHEVEEIITCIARANRFGERSELLSGIGKAFEAAGEAELAARAFTLAYTGHRGGGGWLSFGDEEHEDLLVSAFNVSRPLALAILAQEMARHNGSWGVTRHVIGFLGRHDDVALATEMWDEAFESMLVRLPGHETAQGPFLPFEPGKVPTWGPDDAAIFLTLSRISHPESRRKSAAICAAAWLVQREPANCVTAFREILKSSLCFTHQIWVLNILAQFEPAPFVISHGLSCELNGIVGSGRCATEQLALMLLRRAKIVVTGTAVRNRPIMSTTLSSDKQEQVLSLDVGDVVPRVANLWPDFPEIVAARFQTVFESDASHLDQVKHRWEASRSSTRKSYPSASLHPWEAELFSECLNEVLTGLESHLWSKGEWDDQIWPEVLSLLLPNAQIPARHYWSRRVRPSWPLPSALHDGVYAVESVPDGELVGWVRIAYFETLLECETSYDEIKLKTRATAGVVLNEESPSFPKGSWPLRRGDERVWLNRFRSLFRLDGFRDTLAGHTAFGIPFEFHEMLGLIPSLAASLELQPRSELGPLDLFDKVGNIAVAYRWWRCRPLGDHGFADENPRLFGGSLLMRPDLFAEIVSATKLNAYEAISLGVKTTEQLIAKEVSS